MGQQFSSGSIFIDIPLIFIEYVYSYVTWFVMKIKEACLRRGIRAEAYVKQ
jgi:hypothetical protein